MEWMSIPPFWQAGIVVAACIGAVVFIILVLLALTLVFAWLDDNEWWFAKIVVVIGIIWIVLTLVVWPIMM
jgi:hypothetical protein